MTTDNKAPREFWISLGEECDDILWEHHPKNEHFNFHLIEKSAYDKLQLRLEKCEGLLKELYVTNHGENCKGAHMLIIKYFSEVER